MSTLSVYFTAAAAGLAVLLFLGFKRGYLSFYGFITRREQEPGVFWAFASLLSFLIICSLSIALFA